MSTSFQATKNSALRHSVGYVQGSEWDLVFRVKGKELLRQTVNKQTAPDGWLEVETGLQQFAGEDVRLDVSNEGDRTRLPFAYWAKLEVIR